MSKRIVALDGIRGIAALIIILFHYTTRYNEIFLHSKQPYYLDFKYGYMAICIFFILSGFLCIQHIESEISGKQFVLRRALRLYPTYWVAILITSIVNHLFLPERACSLKEIIINFSMLQGFMGVSNVDGAYWTLRIELIFYFLLWIVIILKKQDKLKLLCCIWSGIAFISQMIKLCGIDIINIVDLVFAVKYSSMFTLGVMACYIANDKEKDGILCLNLLLSIVNISMYNSLLYMLVSIIISVTLCLLVRYKIRLRLFESSFFVFIGSISYPLYLVHQNVGYSIIKGLESYGLTNEIYVLVPIIIVIFLAFVINKYIEGPINKRFRNRFL